MTRSNPLLYLFAISHFCEKARFALDYLGIEFSPKHLAPGAHINAAKELGAAGSSLPILVADDAVIQGSAEIISWAEAAYKPGRSLTPPHARRECLAIEKRLDDIAGVHTRRAFYSEALLEAPETVLPIFTRDLSSEERAQVIRAWPVIVPLMAESMNLGREQGEESVRLVDGELRWLDELLADGRPFLSGDQFSRADIAAASILAPLVKPSEHPTYAALPTPPRLEKRIAEWRHRPSLEWVGEIYRQFRRPLNS